jgi:precorrin isomerase
LNNAKPALIHSLFAAPMDGAAIEERSLFLIDREAQIHSFAADEWAVVRRMIHSTADFSMIDLVRFSQDAISAGRKALKAGAPIFADSNMIRAGLSLARLKQNTAMWPITMLPSRQKNTTCLAPYSPCAKPAHSCMVASLFSATLQWR